MKNLTKTQRAAVELLRARLDPKHPMFAGSREVEQALSGPAKVYFDTWVLPLIDYLAKGEDYFGQAEDIKAEHNQRASAAQARRRAVEAGMI